MKKLYNIYSGSDDDETLLETIGDLKRQIKQVNAQIELDTKNSIIHNRRKEKIKTVETINSLWDLLDVKQKKNIIRKLVSKVTINDKHVSIDFSL